MVMSTLQGGAPGRSGGTCFHRRSEECRGSGGAGGDEGGLEVRQEQQPMREVLVHDFAEWDLVR